MLLFKIEWKDINSASFTSVIPVWPACQQAAKKAQQALTGALQLLVHRRACQAIAFWRSWLVLCLKDQELSMFVNVRYQSLVEHVLVFI